VVVELLLLRDEPLSVARREEEAAVRVVAEPCDRLLRQATCLLQPPKVAGRDVELEQPVRDVGVVVEEAGAARPSLPPARRTDSAAATPAWTYSARPSRRPASASAAIASPFQDEIALSSRAGFGRCSRRSKSRTRVSSSSVPRSTDRPSSNGSSSSAGAPSSTVHVNVSPSTPSVSASWADAKAPSGSRSSRSR
jgi:hypothetical protein